MLEEVHAIIQDTLLAATQQFPGLTDIFQLIQRETGRVLIITIWETEEQARALPVGDFTDERVARMMQSLVAPMQDELYEMRM